MSDSSPPKRRIPFVMDVGHQLFSSELPKVYEFQVDADGPFGRVGMLTYTVDLEVLRDSALETDSVEWSVHQVANDLVLIWNRGVSPSSPAREGAQGQAWGTAVARITSNSSKLRVVTWAFVAASPRTAATAPRDATSASRSV